ncbi:hypothetical protein [Streptomyces palmae]|uniref:hypothetical protein n=1 Tax=Streptomyces palmae TaxID=1701085 RepID=UPI001ADFF309|nr:hypothetical protein [Streptomyces palmae]
MTTDLGLLLTAAGQWEAMAGELQKVETRYGNTVQKITMGSGWNGISAGFARTNFAATRYEYAAAQIEAKAVAGLLREAHEKFTDLRNKLTSARADAIAAGMTVSEEGHVAFDWAALTPAERSAYHHDPDGQKYISDSVSTWQEHIDDRVKAFAAADLSVKTALEAAVLDSNKDLFTGGNDETLNGFNRYADSELDKTGAGNGKDKDKGKEPATKTDGWHTEGTTSATGPAAGFTYGGPKYGKEGSAKLYADLGHATAQGTTANGPWRLSGIGDAYAGARATANWGFNESGITGKAEVSAGGRAMAEGRIEVAHVGLYERVDAFAGGEASVSAGAGTSGVNAGAKVFAGAKVSVAGGGEVAGIGGGGTAEGWAGAGAEAKVTFGMGDDGKFHIGGKVGVAVGVGGSVGAEFTIDPKKVADATSDAVDFVTDTADHVLDGLAELTQSDALPRGKRR